MSNYLIFDIETIPDTESGAELLNLKEMTQEDIIKAMEHTRFQKSGTIMQPNHLQKVICISVIFKKPNQDPVIMTLGDSNSSEKEIITLFFKTIDKYQPTIISWNGKGFDMPVLHYRALKHSIISEVYWQEGVSDFKYNNYLNKFHNRHLDLMNKLSNFTPGAPLSDISHMIGAPGKQGIDGSQVCEYFLDGKISEIRNYCETDVLNTYIVFLRYLLITCEIDLNEYSSLINEILHVVKESDKEHLKNFYDQCDVKRLLAQ